MLKNRAHKTEKNEKRTPKWLQKPVGILGEMPVGAPLVVQTVFVMKKLAPSAPKVRPRAKNEPNMIPENTSNVKKNSKKSPECEKELQMWTLFGARPGGLRGALTIILF